MHGPRPGRLPAGRRAAPWMMRYMFVYMCVRFGERVVVPHPCGMHVRALGTIELASLLVLARLIHLISSSCWSCLPLIQHGPRRPMLQKWSLGLALPQPSPFHDVYPMQRSKIWPRKRCSAAQWILAFILYSMHSSQKKILYSMHRHFDRVVS